MIRETSIATYHQIQEEGLLSERRNQVFKCLWEHGPMTQNETYVKLNVPNLQQSSIMPRFAELKDLGVIDDIGKRICTVTGRMVLEWEVTGELPIKKDKKTFKQQKELILADIIDLGNRIPPPYKAELRAIYHKLNALNG
jgi:hypothetical protein